MRNHITRMLHSEFTCLGMIVICLHVYSFFVFGATFWFDSIAYACMGHDLVNLGFAEFYSGPRAFGYGHICPGAGFLWYALSVLFGQYAWIGLAVIQHAFAVAATLYFLAFFRKKVASVWLFLVAIVWSLQPFLRAFDNALMTESLTSSLLLMLLGAACRLLEFPPTRTSTVIFLVAGCLGIQFRPYFFLVCLGLVGVLMVSRISRVPLVQGLLSTALQATVLMAAYGFFPSVRWWETGEFFFPACGYAEVAHALDNTPEPEQEYRRLMAELDLGNHLDPEKKLWTGCQYASVNDLAVALRDQGHSLRQVHKMLNRQAWKVRTHSSIGMVNHVNHGLISCGFTGIEAWLAREHHIRQNFTVQEYLNHCRRHYRWLAWISQPDYTASFDDFLNRYLQQPNLYYPQTVHMYDQALRPYLKNSSTFFRDPLSLIRIPLGIWFGVGLLGWCVLLYQRFFLALLVFIPVAINFLVTSIVGLGDLRYFHPLFPLYIFLSFYFIGWLAILGKRALWKGKEPFGNRNASAFHL